MSRFQRTTYYQHIFFLDIWVYLFMAKLKKRLRKFVGRNICTAVEIFGQRELKRELWYAKMALTLSMLTKAPNRHKTQQSSICSRGLSYAAAWMILPTLVLDLQFGFSLHPSVVLQVPLNLHSGGFLLFEARCLFFARKRHLALLAYWIESGLLNEIKLTWLPVVHDFDLSDNWW